MTELVWAEAWQFQCCGAPASVGDAVTWEVADVAPDDFEVVLGPEWAARVLLAEDHHDVNPGRRPISGTVTSIREVTYRRQSAPTPEEPGARVPAPDTRRLKSVTAMDPWGPERRTPKGSAFRGWIVGLRVGTAEDPA